MKLQGLQSQLCEPKSSQGAFAPHRFRHLDVSGLGELPGLDVQIPVGETGCGPKLHEAWQYAQEYEEKQLAWWAAESFTKSYESNQDRVKWKVWVLKVNVALIALQTVAMGLCLGLIALN